MKNIILPDTVANYRSSPGTNTKPCMNAFDKFLISNSDAFGPPAVTLGLSNRRMGASGRMNSARGIR